MVVVRLELTNLYIILHNFVCMPRFQFQLVNNGSLWHAVSIFCRMRFQFWIGKFLIKLQCIVLHFDLGYWKEPWFGPAGSENACIFHMRKRHVATKFNDIFKKRVRFFSSCKVKIDKKGFFPLENNKSTFQPINSWWCNASLRLNNSPRHHFFHHFVIMNKCF